MTHKIDISYWSAIVALSALSSGTLAYADPVTIAGPQSSHLQVEAVDKDILRIWAKNGSDFVRTPSNALTKPAESGVALLSSDGPEQLVLRTADLQVSVDKKTFSFTVKSPVQTIIKDGSITWTNPDGASSLGSWSLTYALRSDEHLLGLGQDNRNGGRLDRRGTTRDLWTGQQINSGNVTANYPVPLLLSVGSNGNAYGIFIDDTHRLHFDLGAADKNTLRCDADGGEADLYVIDGPTLKQVIERYTALTGRPPLPPLWTLGYWQSKCVFWDWQDIDKATSQLTARGFPYDAIVIDYDWPEYLNDYVWDKRWYGAGYTPDSKIAAYAKQGVKIVLSNSGPMVVKNSPTFPSGWKAGVFATDGHGNPVEAGYYHGELLDFTSPAMDSWLLPQVAPLIKSGVAGWWLDLSEPEGDSPDTVYQGGDSASIHNQYSLFETCWFENAQLKTKPDVRPWVLTRCASAGIQKYHMSVWTGDTHSDYATLRAHPPEMLNSGLSGLTYWTSDSGGFLSGFYKNDQFGAHAKLYERWMQFSAFSPITRAHHAGPVLPYEFGPETEKGCLHYLQLRYELLPYIYSYAWEASRTGLPIVRPLLLEYPQDPGSLNAPGDEYLFGRELLVAPVLTEDATSRSVYFPPGKWFDWDTGAEYDGGKTIVVAAPQHRIPVAVRAGAIIPMAPLMRNTSEAPWDPITLEVFPSGTSSFTMYKDDGQSFKYRTGDETVTQFTSTAAQKWITLKISESNKIYAPHQYVVHFHLQQRPIAISIDGAPAMPVGTAIDLQPGDWAWDSVSGVLTTRLGSGSLLQHTITAQLKTLPHPE